MQSMIQERYRVWAWRLAVCIALLAGRHAIAQPGRPVSLTAVPTSLKNYAVAAGKRLQTPGKERTTAAGTLLTVSGETATTAPATVVWQIPGKIRVNAGGPPLIFDPSAANPVRPSSQADSDLIEALSVDSVEGLVSITDQTGAARLLGTGVRMQGAPTTAPSYDIVQMLYFDTLKQGKKAAKAYWFDGATKLLAKVTYLSDSGAPVEVSLGNWQTIQGESIPFLIERRENNQLTMRLTLTSATVGAGANDNTFGGN
jgi:hypothetical protein